MSEIVIRAMSNDDLAKTLDEKLLAMARKNAQRARTDQEWVNISPPHQEERRNASEFYSMLLTFSAVLDCSELYFTYHGTSFGMGVVRPRQSGETRIPLSLRNVPNIIPVFLEGALTEVYTHDVRTLSDAEELHEGHLICHPKTKEPIAIFDSFLYRIPFPDGCEYKIRIEVRRR